MPRPAVTITGVSVLALMVAAAAPSLVGAKGHRQRAALVADAGPSGGAGIAVPTSAATKSAVATGIGGYVNPLMVAQVVPERIDQGVDYAGTGVLVALGAGRVTYSAASDTAWPGAFVEYRLTSGVYAGRYVYYAEGITPQVHVGEKLRAGQAVAKLIPRYSYGIEIGWGAGIGTETYAMQHGQWNSSDDADNVPSTAGRNFSRLIAELGGPPGKVEG